LPGHVAQAVSCFGGVVENAPLPSTLKQAIGHYQVNYALHQRSSFHSVLVASGEEEKRGIHWSERKLVTGTTREQFFDVITDVESYSEFVPYVQKSVEFRDRARDNYKEAELEVGFALIRENYISKIEMEPHSVVTTRTDDSRLFSHLTSRWKLSQGVSPKSVWVDFEVDFGFTSPVYDNLAHVFLEEVVKKMMGAFEERGKMLHSNEK